MEPITYYFDIIDRAGIAITPKEPFKNWLKSIYPDTTDNDFEYLYGEKRSSKKWAG